MIRRHPDDTRLMALAAGRMAPGLAVVIDAHVERCARCQARLRDFDAVGGVLLESLEPAPLAPESLALSLAGIDAGRGLDSRRSTPPTPGPGLRARLPDGLGWPRSLRGSTATAWRWLGPGMRWSRVTLADDPEANVFLLRIAASKSLPAHTHTGSELMQILYGSFHYGSERYAAGDFDDADSSVHHEPVVEPGGECICLAALEGRLTFDSRLAGVLGSLVGM